MSSSGPRVRSPPRCASRGTMRRVTSGESKLRPRELAYFRRIISRTSSTKSSSRICTSVAEALGRLTQIFRCNIWALGWIIGLGRAGDGADESEGDGSGSGSGDEDVDAEGVADASSVSLPGGNSESDDDVCCWCWCWLLYSRTAGTGVGSSSVTSGQTVGTSAVLLVMCPLVAVFSAASGVPASASFCSETLLRSELATTRPCACLSLPAEDVKERVAVDAELPRLSSLERTLCSRVLMLLMPAAAASMQTRVALRIVTLTPA